MNFPKRHHYLPESYLNNFCIDGKLCLYDRVKKEYRIQKPINTAVIGHYYTALDKNGNKMPDVERFLAYIEGLAVDVIKKIHDREILTLNNKYALSVFISFIRVRVPNFEKSVDNDLKKFVVKFLKVKSAFSNDCENEEETSVKMTDEELLELIENGKIDITMDKNHRIRQMMQIADNLKMYFYQMNWDFAFSGKGTSFITTDNPLSMGVSENARKNLFMGLGGILTPGVMKILPISQNVCLIMGDRGDEIKFTDISKKSVREINLLLAKNSRRFVIARDKILLKNLVKYSRI